MHRSPMHMQTISDGCAMLVLVVSKGTTDNTTHYNHIRLTARAQDRAITDRPLDRSRLVDPVNLPCPAVDELEPEAIVVLGRTAMAESGRGGGASREHRANPRSVGIVGGVCGSD